jgi:hypothetical protein
MRNFILLFNVFLLSALAQQDVPPTLVPVFNMWSQAAYYGVPEKCCGAFAYRAGQAVSIVGASGSGHVGLCSADLGAWELFEGGAGTALHSIGAGPLQPDERGVDACRARMAPLTEGLEFTPAIFVLPYLADYFSLLEKPSPPFVGRIQADLLADLRRRSQACKLSTFEVGKWTPESGQGFARAWYTKKGCPSGLFAFDAAAKPPAASPLANLPKGQAAALEWAIRRQQASYYQAKPSRIGAVLEYTAISVIIAAPPVGGIYLIATSPQGTSLQKDRLLGGISLLGITALMWMWAIAQ